MKRALLLWEKKINYDFYNRVLRPEKDEVNRKFSILHSKELYLCNLSTIFKLVNLWRLQSGGHIVRINMDNEWTQFNLMGISLGKSLEEDGRMMLGWILGNSRWKKLHWDLV